MDYEKAYTNAVTRAKQAIKDCGHNEGRKRMIEDIFPELADPDRIRNEIIAFVVQSIHRGGGTLIPQEQENKWIAWLEKQGERNSADPFLNWLEKQGEWNNLVEQLTAFAQHLNKRGAFREDLCMDFEHEAQLFIEFIEYQNNKEL